MNKSFTQELLHPVKESSKEKGNLFNLNSPVNNEELDKRLLEQDTMEAYDNFAKVYEIYADGDVKNNLYDFKGRYHAFSDSLTLNVLTTKVMELLNHG